MHKILQTESECKNCYHYDTEMIYIRAKSIKLA